MEELLQRLDDILKDDIGKIVLSSPKAQKALYRRVNILRKEKFFQVEKYTEKQVFHENIEEGRLREVCFSYLSKEFSQLHAFGREGEYAVRISKKGKVLFQKSKAKAVLPKLQPHNRKKKYFLEEGTAIPPLVDMGIFTKEGKVVSSMYDKFRQINKFIEILLDTLRGREKKELHIIDFGCGKSYLTFIIYYYLTEVKKWDVFMTGLDLKEDVIKKCREAAEKYGYRNLKFEVGDINGFQSQEPVDMVISLHACDTATDYALYHAATSRAEIILSVPCCQHELCGQMNGEGLNILKRYGIIRERAAALMTDAIRCNLLTGMGYKTQLLEFVDLNHTPKNLLIRAVKTHLAKEHRRTAIKEAEELMHTFEFHPTLYSLLQEELLRI